MNELTQLLEQLADKLGTSTEYLWGVLLSQASISATMSLFWIVMVLLPWFFAFKYIKKLCMIYVMITILVLAYCAPDMIAGYFNPEYWALKEILNTI